MKSQIPGFYKMSVEERLVYLKMQGALAEEDLQQLKAGLDISAANRMAENVIGMTQIPLGIASNFRINGRDYLIPMATEEPSVVAAASHAAKLALPEGFTASSTRPVMRGQIQLVGIANQEEAERAIVEAKGELIEKANGFADILPQIGGGVLDVTARPVGPREEGVLVVEFFIDCRDAMGANTVNTVAEGMAPEVARIAGGHPLLRIISNLATERLARARVVYRKEAIGGEGVVDGIVKAYRFAFYDPYRAATHNKGIMNGITALTLATINDSRAIEAGAHAYAAVSGRYLPLSRWGKDSSGNLVGEIELPLAYGLVGGATKSHPVAQVCVKLLGVKTSTELAEVAASLGLAQNFAALRALTTEGIQRGHMELHARNIAVMAGARGDVVDKVAEVLTKERDFKVSRAKQVLEELGRQGEEPDES
jgi:hydroxymethylglutaryl-CoA reductase